MKSSIDQIKNIYRKIRELKFSYKRKETNPKHDWQVILTVYFILFCMVIAGSLYLYIQIDQGKLFSININNTNKELKLNSDLLKKIVDELNQHSNSFNLLKQNKSIPTEPS